MNKTNNHQTYFELPTDVDRYNRSKLVAPGEDIKARSVKLSPNPTIGEALANIPMHIGDLALRAYYRITDQKIIELKTHTATSEQYLSGNQVPIPSPSRIVQPMQLQPENKVPTEHQNYFESFGACPVDKLPKYYVDNRPTIPPHGNQASIPRSNNNQSPYGS